MCCPNDEASCHTKAIGWSLKYIRRKARLNKETNINNLVSGDIYDFKIK